MLFADPKPVNKLLSYPAAALNDWPLQVFVISLYRFPLLSEKIKTRYYEPKPFLSLSLLSSSMCLLPISLAT